MPDTILGVWSAAENKTEKNHCPYRACILTGYNQKIANIFGAANKCFREAFSIQTVSFRAFNTCGISAERIALTPVDL